jgi:20S proteasome subunit alpha 2
MTYSLEYGEPMYVTSLCRDIATTVQEYTISGGVRPFGISMLVAGYDDDGPHLYQIDPSGAYYGNYSNSKYFFEIVNYISDNSKFYLMS